MQQMIGKRVKMHFKVDKKDLFYSGVIQDITDTHIFFKDKYDELLAFRICDLVELRLLETVNFIKGVEKSQGVEK